MATMLLGNMVQVLKSGTKMKIKYTKDDWSKNKLWLYEDLKELLIRTRNQDTYFTTEELRELFEEVYKEDLKSIMK